MVDVGGLFLFHFLSNILPFECVNAIMKVTYGSCHLNSQVVKDLNSIGSKVTLKDLKKYKASESDAIVADMPGVTGYKICTVPPPAGGVTLINILNILKGDNYYCCCYLMFVINVAFKVVVGLRVELPMIIISNIKNCIRLN